MGLSLIMQSEYENGFLMLTHALKLPHAPSACIKLGFALYDYQVRTTRRAKDGLIALCESNSHLELYWESPYGAN